MAARRRKGRAGGARRPGAYSASMRRRRKRVRLIKALAAWAVCLLLAALVAFTVFRLISSAASSKKRELRQAGIEQLESGDYTAAIESFDQALEKSGKRAGAFNNDVLRYRAEAEFKLRDYDAALHTYDLLLESDGGEKASYLYLKSLCYAEKGDADNALAFYEQGLEADGGSGQAPGWLEALTAAGGVCVDTGAYERAMALYQEAVSGGTENGQIYNQIGLCQMAEEDYEGALASFDKGYTLLAQQYNAGTGAAFAQLQAAIPPEQAADALLLKELAFNRAAVREYLGQYGEAESLFEEYVQAFGEDEEARHEIDFLKTRH